MEKIHGNMHILCFHVNLQHESTTTCIFPYYMYLVPHDVMHNSNLDLPPLGPLFITTFVSLQFLLPRRKKRAKCKRFSSSMKR